MAGGNIQNVPPDSYPRLWKCLKGSSELIMPVHKKFMENFPKLSRQTSAVDTRWLTVLSNHIFME